MPAIDLLFRLQGDVIPADHGYALFSAISHVLPSVHSDDGFGIHPINGRLAGGRLLALTPSSRLTLRLPAERLPEVLPLAGKRLCIGDYLLRVGVPEPKTLVPSPSLYSRLVVIKGFMEPEAFLQAAARHLAELGVRGRASLVPQPQVAAANATAKGGSRSPYLRRTLRIRDKEVVGFALRVEELTAEESITLQERGLGGRRRFGCGIFGPHRGA